MGCCASILARRRIVSVSKEASDARKNQVESDIYISEDMRSSFLQGVSYQWAAAKNKQHDSTTDIDGSTAFGGNSSIFWTNPSSTKFDGRDSKWTPLSPNVVASKARGGILSQSFKFLSSSAHHLKNIFAQPISHEEESCVPIERCAKTEEETHFLLKILQEHYLFEQVEEEHIRTLVSVFEKVELYADDDPILIRQGELADKDKAFFFVLYRGECTFTVDNVVSTQMATPGDSFGELALLYDCPRAATVTAVLDSSTMLQQQQQLTKANEHPDTALSVTELTSSEVTSSTFALEPHEHSRSCTSNALVVLFRVDQLSFRQVLHNADRAIVNSKLELLSHISFLDELSADRKAQLAAAMEARPFKAGEYLIRRGCTNGYWFLIEHGVVMAKNISYGANHRWNGRMSIYGAYKDVDMGRYDSFGHRSVVTGEPAVADCVARSQGLAFVIDRETFHSVLGDLAVAVLRSNDEMKLRSIPILAETTQLDSRMLAFLASQIKEETFAEGTIICEQGEPIERLPALYIVRKGKIKVEHSDRTETVLPDGYFGDDELMADTFVRETFRSSYTATVVETCELGVLTLHSCRRILDTYRMGKAQNIREFDSLVVYNGQHLKVEDFKLHRLIGAGTFGQVWLVSREDSNGKRRPYALKVQSKYELCKSSQAKLIVREKNVMAQFHNPFIGKLVSSFQDDRFVYMAMDLLQGGELYSLMHRSAGNTMSESEAMFYIACIAQGLGYMHRLGFVYRDLKPENVMIDNQVILNRGYNWSADHWSLGVVLYEILIGQTPFYRRDMTKTDLFRSILKDRVPVPEYLSSTALNLISGLLKRDCARRLGSLASGEDGILGHKWFEPIDQDLLFLKELEAPYLPNVADVLDDSHFEDWGHLEDLRGRQYPELSPEQKELFKSF